jgi:GNAT superfamily N-acetyltransferase
MIEIIPAQTGDPLEHFITLSREYVAGMLVEVDKHYPDLDVPVFTADHNYDDVRKKFPGVHVPPHGCLLLAMEGDQVAGCIALAPLTQTICEMRTLYVRPVFRGAGVGRKLIEALLIQARAFGYAHIRLDTLRFMAEAYALYQAFGFYEIAPYTDLPDSLKPYLRYLECRL